MLQSSRCRTCRPSCAGINLRPPGPPPDPGLGNHPPRVSGRGGGRRRRSRIRGAGCGPCGLRFSRAAVERFAGANFVTFGKIFFRALSKPAPSRAESLNIPRHKREGKGFELKFAPGAIALLRRNIFSATQAMQPPSSSASTAQAPPLRNRDRTFRPCDRLRLASPSVAQDLYLPRRFPLVHAHVLTDHRPETRRRRSISPIGFPGATVKQQLEAVVDLGPCRQPPPPILSPTPFTSPPPG